MALATVRYLRPGQGAAWLVDHQDAAAVGTAARQKIVEQFSAGQEIDHYLELYARLGSSPQQGAA